MEGKFFQKFTLKQILFILFILTFIPWLLGLMLGVYYIYPHIKEARLQLKAEKHIPPLAEFVWNLQRHRGRSYLYLLLPEGEEKSYAEKEVKQIEGKLEEIYKKLEILYLEEAETKETLKALWEAYQSLKISQFKGTAEESFF